MTALYDDMPRMKALFARLCPEALEQAGSRRPTEEGKEELPEDLPEPKEALPSADLEGTPAPISATASGADRKT